MHILLVEDDEIVSVLMAEMLRHQGYRVSAVETGANMHAFLRAGDPPDLILLDLTLPDEDGLVLARQIRATTDTPIIVVSAREKLDDRLAALESGADDYLIKPFAPEELALRIKNLMARVNRGTSTSTGTGTAEFTSGNLRIDPVSRQVWLNGDEPVDLTTSEFDLLVALANAGGRVLNRDQLLDAINRGNEPPSSRVVDVLIGRVRKKIEEEPRNPRFIRTVTNLGYRFVSE